MRIDWYGHSAFHLTGPEGAVFIDPFGDVSGLAGRGIKFEYPPIVGVDADVVLITHEHGDHNGAEAIGGHPAVLRSTAGRLESPFGEVVAIASEHDDAAGTERGPNTIFVFALDGIRIAHEPGRRLPRADAARPSPRRDRVRYGVAARRPDPARNRARGALVRRQ